MESAEREWRRLHVSEETNQKIDTLFGETYNRLTKIKEQAARDNWELNECGIPRGGLAGRRVRITELEDVPTILMSEDMRDTELRPRARSTSPSKLKQHAYGSKWYLPQSDWESTAMDDITYGEGSSSLMQELIEDFPETEEFLITRSDGTVPSVLPSKVMSDAGARRAFSQLFVNKAYKEYLLEHGHDIPDDLADVPAASFNVFTKAPLGKTWEEARRAHQRTPSKESGKGKPRSVKKRRLSYLDPTQSQLRKLSGMSEVWGDPSLRDHRGKPMMVHERTELLLMATGTPSPLLMHRRGSSYAHQQRFKKHAGTSGGSKHSRLASASSRVSSGSYGSAKRAERGPRRSTSDGRRTHVLQQSLKSQTSNSSLEHVPEE